MHNIVLLLGEFYFCNLFILQNSCHNRQLSKKKFESFSKLVLSI